MSIEPIHPSKQFKARGARIARCAGCLMPAHGCVCDFQVQVRAQASFWLLTHRYELYKPTNTGRLIVDCIADSRVFEWRRTEPEPSFLAALDDPAMDPYLVFPEDVDYRHRMVTYAAKPGRRPVFLILDGTWRQARRMFRHSRYLDRLPVIQPQTERRSRYLLRKAQQDHHLCTAEVAAAMLEQIGDHASAQLLDACFDVFNQHYRASRLTRPISEDTEAKRLIRTWQAQSAGVAGDAAVLEQ